MRVIDLVLKDLSQMLRDRRTLIFFFVMPIAFTLLLGFMFGGMGGGEIEDSRLPVGVLVEDDENILTSALVAVLESSDVFQLVWNEELAQSELSEQVADGDLAGALIIPAEYGQQVKVGDPLPLNLILDPSSTNGFSIEYSVSSISTRFLRSALTAQLSINAFQSQQAFISDQSQLAFYNTSFDKALAAWQEPPVTVTNSYTGQDQEEGQSPFGDNPYVHTSPGMMLQFAIAGLVSAAEIIVNERKSRSLQRLLTTSISRFEILLGHYLSMFTMIFTQIMILMVFGQFVLKLDYLHAPLASLLMAVAISLCVAALGLLIGAISKTSENTVVYSLIPMFVFSGLGGAWMPLEFTSETVQMVGHFTPVAWGMDGLKNILIRGQGLEAAWLPAGMLLVFTAVFFGLAVWRFKFE